MMQYQIYVKNGKIITCYISLHCNVVFIDFVQLFNDLFLLYIEVSNTKYISQGCIRSVFSTHELIVKNTWPQWFPNF